MASNVSNRQNRQEARTAKPGIPTNLYEIVDRSHTPDLRGEFAGAKVNMRDGKQTVMLTEAQAKFYLDHGTIALFGTTQPAPQPAPKPSVQAMLDKKSAIRRK